jgi:hypothetical protein
MRINRLEKMASRKHDDEVSSNGASLLLKLYRKARDELFRAKNTT